MSLKLNGNTSSQIGKPHGGNKANPGWNSALAVASTQNKASQNTAVSKFAKSSNQQGDWKMGDYSLAAREKEKYGWASGGSSNLTFPARDIYKHYNMNRGNNEGYHTYDSGNPRTQIKK